MDIWKSAAALVAGALVSVAVGLAIKVWAPTTDRAIVFAIGILGVLVLILILYVSGAISKQWHRLRLWWRGLRWRKRLIGILSDAGEVEDRISSSCTDIGLLDWQNQIERAAQANSRKVKVKLIKTQDDFTPYRAILNPYGGAYPERDVVRLETLDKILEYVNDKGLFVNVADIPGYYVYNFFIRHIHEAAPLTSVSDPKRPPFWLGPFMQKLGLGPDVHKVETVDFENKPANIGEKDFQNWEGEFEAHYGIPGKRMLRVHRVVVIERNARNVVPIMQPKTIDNKRVTPVFFARYGKGKCLVSLPLLGDHPDKQADFMKEKLTKILLDIVCKKK